MTIRAHAKINWALNVLGTRPDGYHALDSVLSRVSLYDTLTFSPSEELSLSVEGGEGVPTDTRNLALRAAVLLRENSGSAAGVHIHLHKSIPAQAGLGGGSADAAAALLGLNQYWGLGLSIERLHYLAAHLGSDVPACLYPGLTRIGGRGEEVTPVGSMQTYNLLLLKPAVGLSTAEVFHRYDAAPDARQADIPALITALQGRDIEGMARHAHNQLQRTAESMLPEINEALADLLRHGAAFARMTGSGSAVFGVFSNTESALRAERELRKFWPTCMYMTTKELVSIPTFYACRVGKAKPPASGGMTRPMDDNAVNSVFAMPFAAPSGASAAASCPPGCCPSPSGW